MRKFLFLSGFIMAFFFGCTDNTTDPGYNGKAALKLYLVDSPADLDSVIIYVERVEVHKSGSDNSAGWTVINNIPAKYNLLGLTNGASAVLGDTVLDPGTYTQIRLILGTNNYVVDKDMNKYYLEVPSGMQTGIKLIHEFTLEPDNLYEYILDFNVARSIHVTGNGKYMMKPVIRVMPLVTSGTISGQVLPLDADAVVYTKSGSDSVSTYPDTEGFFKLMALPQGIYDVVVFPDTSKYKIAAVNGVSVSASQNTDIGLIQLETK